MHYNNFELYNPFISLDLIVWALFAGCVVASLMAIYNKRIIGGFVKAVLKNESLSPETAKTVTELGFGSDWIIKNALRTDTVLRRFIVRIDKAADGGEAPIAEEDTKDAKGAKKKERQPKHDVIDFTTARFYIPEELKYKAEVRYASRGTDLITFVIAVVVLIAAALAAIYFIPDLIQLIDNLITQINTSF